MDTPGQINERPSASNGLNRSPSTSNGSRTISSEERKRKLMEWADSQIPRRPRSSMDTEVQYGPKYEQFEDSLILYNPKDLEKYHSENNTNGYVPVVVHPELVKGSDPKKEEKLTEIQVKGLNFMWNSFHKELGCILAHDMGLGKTRTTIALILTLLEQSERQRGRSLPGVKKCIVVAPKGIVQTWQDEFLKWTPRSLVNPIKIIFSNKRDSEQILNEFDEDSRIKLLILSYNSFKKYIPEMKGFKNHIDLVVCDEAHILKNDATDRSTILKGFKELSRKTVWIGLTGTPYQNSIEEYANLVNFFRPDVIEKKYKTNICRPIMNYYKKHGELDDKLHKQLVKLKRDTAPVLLYESNILDIDKHEMIICVPLDPGPKELNEEPIIRLQHELYQELTQNLTPMKGLSFYQKLDLLTKLCIHPLNAYKGKEDMEEFASHKESLDFLHGLDESGYIFSRKIQVVFAMLMEIIDHSDEKAVVVSNSTQLLKMIAKFLKQKFSKAGLNVLWEQYDGETSEKKRDQILKSFETNENVRILLLSCKSGGTGLTLTRANHLFLMDPDWNPANDRQAMARIYRHGQTRTVYVYRFLCTGTIEEIKFLNQLSKEEFDKFFKGCGNDGDSTDQDKKVMLPFGGNDLIKYYPNTKSHIQDLLEQLQNPEDMDMEEQQFAEELNNSAKYQRPNQVPNELPILENIWKQKENLISFVFHTKKTKDILEDFLFTDEEVEMDGH